jgi:hypothetical protein
MHRATPSLYAEPMITRDTIWSPGTRLRYMAQLDALRAFAVGLVLLYHFWRPARQSVHFGSIGVRIFFVLSGFLITGILLQSRRRLDQGESGAGGALRRFYLRRILRIFPLYYFGLAVAWFGKVAGAREGWDGMRRTCPISTSSSRTPSTRAAGAATSRTSGRSRWKSSSTCSGPG